MNPYRHFGSYDEPAIRNGELCESNCPKSPLDSLFFAVLIIIIFLILSQNVIMESGAFVYFMTNKHNTTLYIGVTNDILRRVAEHKAHINKGFTDKYNYASSG